MTITVVMHDKAGVYDSSLPGIAGSNITDNMIVCLLLVL
jgi:hypothetical protein